MYIEPNNSILLLNNVPLDNTYEHTAYFSSATAQHTYFASKVKYTFSKQSYQRVQRGKARVNQVADNLYDCNYMMFQNTNFGTKWFYAFVVSVEYLNNVTSEITFEIDVMQTWAFNYTRELCYVERCHTRSDVIGEHIEPEPLPLGEYKFNSYGRLTDDLTTLCVIIAISDTDVAPTGRFYDGVFGGATLYAFNTNDTSGINDKLTEYIQKPDAIVAMYIAPKYAAVGSASIPTGGTLLTNRAQGFLLTLTESTITKGTTTLDGFTPANAKLYTYPYTAFMVTNASGASLTLRYEFFSDSQPQFTISTNITQPVQITLRPTHYKGSSTWQNATESLTLADYPMCSWSTDAYKAWIAQNSVPLMANAVAKPVEQMARGAMSGGLVGAAVGLATGAIEQAYNTWQQNYTASIQADIYKGSQNIGNGNTANYMQTFWGGMITQPHQYLTMYDNFFTVYGYACNRCIYPPVNNRPHYTYVKTVGCNLTGSVPADDMRKICGIFDKGITFWNTPSEIGNYNVDNRV